MLISENKLIVSKSKFYGFLYYIENIEEYEKIIAEFGKKHRKANHICSACLFEDFVKFKNDREVGSPGKILFSLLKYSNLNSHLLIVVRYFGGIKLGIGGVQRAFRETGRDCIENKNS